MSEEEEIDIPKPSTTRKVLVWGGVIAAIIAAVGVLTTLIGIGPFGYRLFAYGEVTIFVYNGTPHFAEVEVDGSSYEIKPYEGERVEVTGGDIEIDTTLRLVEENEETGKPEMTDKREHLETKSFFGDGNNWLYHVALPESTCLGIMDMSAYYDREAGGKPELVKPVFKDERLQEFEYDEVLYPRSFLPDKANPPVIWLGAVNCEVLAEPEKAVIALRIQAEKARELLERRRREARGGAP